MPSAAFIFATRPSMSSDSVQAGFAKQALHPMQ